MQNLTINSGDYSSAQRWPYHDKPVTKILNQGKNKDLHLKEQNLNGSLLDNDLYYQANSYLSRITDPLWKKICLQVANMMGPFAILKIGGCQLGSLSPKDRALDFYCPTEEAVHFVNQYAFVILGELQQYFPELKELQIKVKI